MKTVVGLCAALGLAFVVSAGASDIRGEEVSYTAEGVELTGYIAYDAAIEDPRPGVLVVHEWWGHNDYVRERARMLAEMGYTALALDMYGDGRLATHPEDAQKFMQEVMSNMYTAQARFAAARSLLESHGSTDASRTAAIGYCFGGAVVLHMARRGMDLDGVASFHGSLATSNPAEPGDLRASVLVLHGADDQFVGPESVGEFMTEMTRAQADLAFISYPGAHHGFSNPEATAAGEAFGLPLAYDEAVDAASWAEMGAFLERVLAH